MLDEIRQRDANSKCPKFYLFQAEKDRRYMLKMVDTQDAEIARLKSENNRLMLQRDRLDCSVREGTGTYHCPVDNPCAACVMRGEIARRKEAVRVRDDAAVMYHDEENCAYCGKQFGWCEDRCPRSTHPLEETDV